MTATQDEVTLGEAMRRGFMQRCPNCAEGRLFRRFLKVVDHCPACGEEFSHHRADDFPPYLVIMIVGHVIVPLLFAVEMAYAPPMWLEFVVWLPLTLLSCLALLQPVKGAVVGMQWQLGMHAFAEAKLRRLQASGNG
ncbi:DUF983 domain-containing protein [Vineibacter terrae]|uniref:DUF983 domain-containing protein n=1 Tax=Vineibacter terrae TaxID=2586908 RepID=A0A5C8PKT0_9HYPH|nr:DUF983 domain-containing protein [Vineibacter terrae]TXL74492.1 DUF983 domain-containing protein [Vineibacter terrae]